MPKNQGHKDKLYISASEHAIYGGGKKRERSNVWRPLPFDNCALSLQPFETPFCTTDGVVFDVLHIMPFLQKHKVNPITSKPMKFKDLVRLTMAKNTEGKWHCPVTFKVFNDNSKIVAIKTSGHVYAWEAVDDLCIKAKNWKDLMTDAPFERKDLIMIQDPLDDALNARRDISNFNYLKEEREKAALAAAATPASQNIRATPAQAELFQEIADGRAQSAKNDEAKLKAANAAAEAELDAIPDLAAIRRLKPTVEDLAPGAQQTHGAGGASQSFTSSSAAVATRTALRPATVEEIREARWKVCRKLGKKGYAQLQTTCGNLNLEVHCDFVPQTSENFLALCASGAYDNSPFHRVIPGFMAQGGDITAGDGTGGATCWGDAVPTFNDEFDSRLVHGGRGTISMANSGKNTNRSQFFVCFRAARHLDNVHTVFAKVVGGMAVLDRIEALPRDKKDKPTGGGCTILKATVFEDPLAEATTTLEGLIQERQAAKALRLSQRTLATGGAAAPMPLAEVRRIEAETAAERKGWHSNAGPAVATASSSQGQLLVGPTGKGDSGLGASAGSGAGSKYRAMGSGATTLALPAGAAAAAVAAAAEGTAGGAPPAAVAALTAMTAEEPEAKKMKQAPSKMAFGNFSSW